MCMTSTCTRTRSQQGAEVGSRPGLRPLVDGRSDLMLVQVGDVAGSENSRHVRLLVRVNDNVPSLGPRDAEILA